MTPGSKVLVIDDEPPIVDLIRGYLVREGFEVVTALDGHSALELARSERPDLVILDLMLPGIDGLEVCRQLRQFSDAYILMLTARTEEVDRIVGLTVGADDYMTKPFSPRELVARARAMLRRPRSAQPSGPESPLRLGDLVIDEAGYEVSRGDELLSLTPIEFSLLATLARQPGMVFSRTQLIEHVWGPDFYGDEHVVDVHLSNLRKKLERDPGHPDYIETVRGVGYRFRKPVS